MNAYYNEELSALLRNLDRPLPAPLLPLQFFAAEDEGRTEDPTDLKIRKSREEGRVAKSKDVPGVVILIFSLVAIAIFAKPFVFTCSQMLKYFFTHIVDAAPAVAVPATVNADLARAGAAFYLSLAAPFLAVAFVAAFLGNVVQTGFVFSTKSLTPDFSRVTPNLGRYLSRTFGSTEAVYNLGASMAKVLIVGVLSYLTLRTSPEKIASTPFVSLPEAAKFFAVKAFVLTAQTAVVLLVLAIVDLIFQRRQYKEQLKMTKQEIKDEMKDQEGNPMVRARMKRRMSDILRATMMQNVPKADVVIANPTHFAVAVEYSMGARAPKVTAKGQDLVALRIKEVAREAGIPIIENKPLARALHASVEIGDEIPEEYWELVSSVLAQVYRMTGRKVSR